MEVFEKSEEAGKYEIYLNKAHDIEPFALGGTLESKVLKKGSRKCTGREILLDYDPLRPSSSVICSPEESTDDNFKQAHITLYPADYNSLMLRNVLEIDGRFEIYVGER